MIFFDPFMGWIFLLLVSSQVLLMSSCLSSCFAVTAMLENASSRIVSLPIIPLVLGVFLFSCSSFKAIAIPATRNTMTSYMQTIEGIEHNVHLNIRWKHCYVLYTIFWTGNSVYFFIFNNHEWFRLHSSNKFVLYHITSTLKASWTDTEMAQKGIKKLNKRTKRSKKTKEKERLYQYHLLII